MVSNANVSQEVCDAFAAVTAKSLRWVICKVEPNSANISLVASGERSNTLEQLKEHLTSDPCFVVYDFEATRDDDSTLCKTCFITFSPDTCTNMALKFELQNFKASVKAKINSQKEMQINDIADFSESEFRDAFRL